MTELLLRKNVLIVKNFLFNFDKNIQLIELSKTANTAIEAAKSLNKEVGSIVKSLVFKNNNQEFYLCLVSGDKFVSLKKISKILGEEIIKADADDVKKNTGFSIGGVPPIAHSNNPKKILIDENLERFETVYAAAGHHSVIFGIHFDQLVILTKGEVSKITED